MCCISSYIIIRYHISSCVFIYYYYIYIYRHMLSYIVIYIYIIICHHILPYIIIIIIINYYYYYDYYYYICIYITTDIHIYIYIYIYHHMLSYIYICHHIIILFDIILPDIISNHNLYIVLYSIHFASYASNISVSAPSLRWNQSHCLTVRSGSRASGPGWRPSCLSWTRTCTSLPAHQTAGVFHGLVVSLGGGFRENPPKR